MRVAIVGSGFAGSILARVARVAGHEVTLVERDAHPRFALGESSTPLAAIALERIAARYGLDDLHDLAAYGRWSVRLPDVRRGLKRGFTFYRHCPGEPFRNDEFNVNRLLVAASPDDAVADAHWLREDVDAFLARRAEAEGVRYLDRTLLDDLETRNGGLRLAGTRAGKRIRLTADLVVDASGAGGFLARHLDIAPAVPRGALRTGLVYGHFTGVPPLRLADAHPTRFPAGPYPDERAAVHHLLDEGWMYELAFDHGVVSAGFVVDAREAGPSIGQQDPAATFRALAHRYPSIGERYESALPLRPVAAIPRLQWRLGRAAGANWVLLPHAWMFWSPLFSTGIAWSLVGVERIGLILESAAGAPVPAAMAAAGPRRRLAAGLRRYAALLRAEGHHLRRLIEGAYRCRRDFDAFAACVQAYFAAASWCEARQRLCPAPAGTGGAWAWSGFLGASDPVLRSVVSSAARLVATQPPEERLDAVGRLIATRNVAGLADPARKRLYPADLEALVTAAGLIGLTRDEVRASLPRLRGGTDSVP